MLAKSKISLVQVARRHLKMTEAAYRLELEAYGGVTSSTDLDERGFAALMNRFQQLGFVSQRTRDGLGTMRPGMATPAQIALIRSLWRELVEHPSDKNLDKWIERSFGVSAARLLTEAKAHKVVGSMRAWQKRKASQNG